MVTGKNTMVTLVLYPLLLLNKCVTLSTKNQSVLVPMRPTKKNKKLLKDAPDPDGQP